MCPSSATITSLDFNNFVQKTKAKASEVNENFSIWRGHVIPFNADTISASDNTHDLGASDHRWANIYVNNPPVIGVQAINKVWAGPTAGASAAPTFRALDPKDMPPTIAIFMFNQFI